MGLLPSRSAYMGEISAGLIANLGHVIVCLWSVPLSSQQDRLRRDGASAASRQEFSAVENPRGQEGSSQGAAASPHGVGSGCVWEWLRSGFAFKLSQKREFLWQLGSGWSPAVGTPWVPPQRMA